MTITHTYTTYQLIYGILTVFSMYLLRKMAATVTLEQETQADFAVMNAMQNQELKQISETCMRKFWTLDSKDSGFIKVSEFRKILVNVSSLGLSENDISKICQLIPRNSFGRCIYVTFSKVLRQIRFISLRNAIIESQGGLQSLLLTECKQAEAKHRVPVTKKEIETSVKNGQIIPKKFVPSGLLAFRHLVETLQNSSHVSLGKLQVMVLMTDAEIMSDGNVDYFKFIPRVANTIKLLFEPRNLRQRAEMIENEDLSCESLLKGMSSEDFERQLRTMFISYDTNRSGALDQEEFIRCLKSLELELTETEMVGLMIVADPKQIGSIGFEDFVKFLSLNLMHLVREKHLRQLQATFVNRSRSVSVDNGNTSYDVTPPNGLNNSNSGGNNHNSNNNNNNNSSIHNTNHSSSSSMDHDGSEKSIANTLNDAFLIEEAEMTQHLLRIFEFADRERTGLLPYDEVEKILRSLDVRISQFEIQVILSEIATDPMGRIEYKSFAPVCADLLMVRQQIHCLCGCYFLYFLIAKIFFSCSLRDNFYYSR